MTSQAKQRRKKIATETDPRDKTPYLHELKSVVVPLMESYEKLIENVEENTAQNPLRILAIDPGTTNIALCFIDRENNTILVSKVDRPVSLHWLPSQIRYREHIIEQWITVLRPDVIFKEQAIHGNEFGLVESGRLQYAIERVAMEHKIPLLTINTQTMRKYIGATGTEHNKSSIRLRVFQKWGKEFASEDETDAFAIAQTGIAIVTGSWNPKAPKTKEKASGKTSTSKKGSKKSNSRKKTRS